jgi:hypothetical protein
MRAKAKFGNGDAWYFPNYYSFFKKNYLLIFGFSETFFYEKSDEKAHNFFQMETPGVSYFRKYFLKASKTL